MSTPQFLPSAAIKQMEQEIHARLLPLSQTLDAKWLDFCAYRTSQRVTALHRRDSSSLSAHVYFKEFQNAEYYDMELASEDTDTVFTGPLPAACAWEMRLQRAVLTHSMCVEACVAFWAHLKMVLTGKSTSMRN